MAPDGTPDPSPEHPDRRLLAAYRDHRDEEAFRQLLLRHEGWVRHHCRQSLRDEDLADDACQAVFVLLSRRAADIRDGACLAAWLQQVAHGIACNLINARQRQRRHEREAALTALADPPAGPGGDEELVAAQAFLPDCLAELKPIDREVVIRHYLRCQAQTAIADELGLSVDAVQKRVSRAIVRLRALMARRGVVLAPALLMAMASQARATPSPDLVAATLDAVRAGTDLEGRVARLVEGAPIPATGLAATALAGAAAVGVAGLIALAATLVWDRGADATRQRIVSVGAGAQMVDDRGRASSAVPGLGLPAGSALRTATAGEVAVQADLGRWTLRPGGWAEVADPGFRLHAGAAVVEGDGLRVRTPRLDLRIRGRAWILSVEAFDRVDVVEGSAETGDGSPLAAGQALVRGPGLPTGPQPRAPRELAPAFGGLFFREVAAIYARGGRVLADGPGPVTDRHRIGAADGLGIDPGSAPGPVVRRQGDRLVLGHPGGPRPVLGLVPMPPARPGQAWVLRTTARFSGRASIGDGAVVLPLGDAPWSDAARRGLPGPMVSPPPPIRTPITEMTNATVQVGVAPDGRAIWEKTVLYGPDGRWVFPSLMVGPGPVGWEVRLEPGGQVDLERVVLAEAAPPGMP